MSHRIGDADLDRAATALGAGGVVVLPTETVYGVAVAPGVAGATEALFAAKGRDRTKAVAVLVGDAGEALGLLAEVTPAVERLAQRAWPGPLTLVGHRGPAAAGWDLGGDAGTLGVRVPDHPVVLALARRVGPLATTSANASGQATPETAAAATSALAGPVAVTLDGGRCAGVASTVVRLTGQEPEVVRQGPITADQVAAWAQGRGPGATP